MHNKIQKIGDILARVQFSFSEDFSESLMKRIMNMELVGSSALNLTASISRLFYWINVPGLAVTVFLLLFLLLSGDFQPISSQTEYFRAFSDFLNDYYYPLIN